VAQPFSLQPSDEGPRYEGPRGPVVLAADQAPDATRLRGPDGEARLAWGMRSEDRSALERGVPAEIGGRAYVLRKAGRTLELSPQGGGAAIARARRKARGRVAIERPDGEEVASFKATSLSGEVEDGASGEEVALLLLLLGSTAASVLERRVPLPFSPFALAMVLP
jgi:hypothetical protein